MISPLEKNINYTTKREIVVSRNNIVLSKDNTKDNNINNKEMMMM